MSKLGKQVRLDHVFAHVNVLGDKVVNRLATEGMCSHALWFEKRHYNHRYHAESTVGLRGGSDSMAAQEIREK